MSVSEGNRAAGVSVASESEWSMMVLAVREWLNRESEMYLT